MYRGKIIQSLKRLSFPVLNEIIHLLARYLTSFIFLSTGVSKLFVLDSFAHTLSNLVSLDILISYVLSVIVVLMEILIGIFLIINFKINTSFVLASFLLISYVGVLLFGVYKYGNFKCPCFGLFKFPVSAKYQIIFDIFLLFLLSFRKSGINKIQLIPSMIVLVLSLYFFERNLKLQTYEVNLYKLFSGLSESYPDKFISNKSGQFLILFVNFYDFSCHICLEDFLNFSKFVKLHKGQNLNVIFFFGRDHREVKTQEKVMRKWMELNELDFPIVVDSLLIFERNRITKTSALFIDKFLKVYDIVEFPLGNKGNEFIKKIKM